MTRVALVSANLGSYDHPAEWPEQIVPADVIVDVHRFTDETCPPRPLAMTSRLRCGIPKMWAWQMRPGYDVYIWIDASCAPTPSATTWFLEHLEQPIDRSGGSADLVVFRHPERQTVEEEVAFMRARMARAGERYLTSRYQGEWIEDVGHYVSQRGPLPLYASTAFAYRPTPTVTAMLRDWWGLKARFCLHDQIAWPYVMAMAGCRARVINEHYLKCPALTFVRKGIRRVA